MAQLSQGLYGICCRTPGVTVLGRVSERTEYDRNSRVTFRVQDDGDTSHTFYDGVGRVIKTLDPEGNILESWQVPLADYVEAYTGSKDDRVRVHRTMVARALADGIEALAKQATAESDDAARQRQAEP